MSWDVYLTIDTGRIRTDHEGQTQTDPVPIWEGNLTYNLSPMIRALDIHLDHLNGQPATIAEPLLAEAVAHLLARPDVYRKFESTNGWGNMEWCADFLQDFLKACREHPKTTILVQ